MTTLPPASKSAVAQPHRRRGQATRLARFAAAGVVAAVLSGACGGSGSNDATSKSAAASTMTTTAPAAPTGAPTTAGSSTAGVTVRQFQFMPAQLVVKAGTTVMWTNQDQILHTATSGATPGSADGKFDGPMDGPGKSFSFTFDEPGAYPYFCSRHNSMVGEIIIQ